MSETAFLDRSVAKAAPEAAPGMHVELSAEQQAARRRFRTFVDERVAPHAGTWERQGEVPDSFIEELRREGYLGAPLPEEVGGGAMDPITYGLLTAELGRGCSSVRSLLTVHDMVTLATARWAGAALKERYLQEMAAGRRQGALALSEPNVGSDPNRVETRARKVGDHYVLDGRKKWITFGMTADVFLLLAQLEGEGGDAPTAFLVPADAPGLVRRPDEDVMSTRASRLATLELDGCRLPADHILGRPGFGFSHVVSFALDHGRYSVAWGSVGIAEACLEACLDYTCERRQGGALLREHQLVQRLLTEMIADSRAARLLCYRAGHLRATGDPGATGETMIAKYFASRAANRAASDAVQIHGANGLTDRYPVARYFRDAKLMELIEGSNQIQQITIPRFPPQEF